MNHHDTNHNDTEFDSAADLFILLRASDTPGWDGPVNPDPDFAARLSDRLHRGATLPKGITMSDTMIDGEIHRESPGDAHRPEEQPPVVERPGALPYLTVQGAREAIDWYCTHLGGHLRGSPVLMDDNTIGHAEIEIGGGVVYLAEEFPDLGLRGPQPGQVSVSLMLPVADTDFTLERTRHNGAIVTREPDETHGARTATIIDPFGHRWMLTGPLRTGPLGTGSLGTESLGTGSFGTGPRREPRTPRSASADPPQHGDIGFLSLNTPDAARARAFYGTVLGWRFADDDRHVSTAERPLVVVETAGPATIACGYVVEDVGRAREHIVDAGGRIIREPYDHSGRMTVDAADDAGVEFCVYEPWPDERRGQQYPRGIGEMSYLTVHTGDSKRLRDFYRTVLGWTYTSGRIPDGWEAHGPHPQVGIAGGSDSEVAVPMWNVTDIEEAVLRVAGAGGEVISPPERQPYGFMALCTDDQGMQFYLGQMF